MFYIYHHIEMENFLHETPVCGIQWVPSFTMENNLKYLNKTKFNTPFLLPAVITRFANEQFIWTKTSHNTNNSGFTSFTINMNLRYPQHEILYKTTFWQMIKWFLVQYLPVAAILFLICKRIRKFVFTNNVISTVQMIHSSKYWTSLNTIDWSEADEAPCWFCEHRRVTNLLRTILYCLFGGFQQPARKKGLLSYSTNNSVRLNSHFLLQ